MKLFKFFRKKRYNDLEIEDSGGEPLKEDYIEDIDEVVMLRDSHKEPIANHRSVVIDRYDDEMFIMTLISSLRKINPDAWEDLYSRKHTLLIMPTSIERIERHIRLMSLMISDENINYIGREAYEVGYEGTYFQDWLLTETGEHPKSITDILRAWIETAIVLLETKALPGYPPDDIKAMVRTIDRCCSVLLQK